MDTLEQTRTTWEYRVVEVSSLTRGFHPAHLEKMLNTAGADGWELVSTMKTCVVLKRPS